jgi:hypothetical protein
MTADSPLQQFQTSLSNTHLSNRTCFQGGPLTSQCINQVWTPTLQLGPHRNVCNRELVPCQERSQLQVAINVSAGALKLRSDSQGRGIIYPLINLPGRGRVDAIKTGELAGPANVAQERRSASELVPAEYKEVNIFQCRQG